MMRLIFITVLAILSLSVHAGVPNAEQGEALPQSRFQLSHQTELLAQNTATSNAALNSSAELTASESNASYFVGNLQRYDATWLYPVSQSAAMNLDLGLNLRYFDGQVLTGTDKKRVLHNYRSAIPMVYASALFDLPFDGLSARVDGGSQINVEWDQLFTSFDYKASLRYDWRNGLGLEGGWQHRQWQLEDLGSDNRIESKGLYLDLKYQF